MKTPALLVIVLVVILPLRVMGVTPVHMGRVSVDTSLYDFNANFSMQCIPGPFTGWQPYPGVFENLEVHSNSMLMLAFLKKNSKQFDIYSFGGKIGTSVIPIIRETAISCNIIFSCNMIDDDAGWEAIVNMSKDNGIGFFVFDDDGTQLLADSGSAYYGFDGNNTYIVTYSTKYGNYIYDSWRFRTNLSVESPKSLAKTKLIQSSPMQIYGLSGGDYRVTLSPSSGNQITFQMFDLLGRCVFDKQIQNLTSPVSFTVPEANVPNSPFIAKVNDGNGSVVKKLIPVK